jgi:hypothetical protein
MIRAVALCLLPVAAQAQTVALPQGCAAFVTVQSAQCSVTHFYRCDSDPADQIRSVSVFGDGYDFFFRTDIEGRWLETTDMLARTHDRLVMPEADPGLWSDLLDDGFETYDFQTVTDDGTTTRFVGADKLTGAMPVIDGQPLREVLTEMRAETADGQILWSMVRTNYFLDEFRIGIDGLAHWTDPEGSSTTDGTPVTFDRPGEAGFLSASPLYGCAG